MMFESVNVRGPELAEGSEPGVHFMKRFGFKAIDAALCVHGRLHETGFTQNTKMLRNGWLRHAELALDFSDGLSGGNEEAEDGAAVGLGDDVESGFHGYYIRHGVYTCQGIFVR